MARIVDPEEREVDVLQQLVAFRGMNVLDVGCGDGRTTRRIARTAASVIGVDPDPERIALARDAGPGESSGDVAFRVGDAVTLEFPAGKFDAVVFTRSL